MLIDLHGGPFIAADTDSEVFTVGARATLRLSMDEHEYIWTLGLSWKLPLLPPWYKMPLYYYRRWLLDVHASEHTAYLSVIGFNLYVTWW